MTSQFDSSVSAETIAQSFVFIDASVEDRRTLINSVAPGTAVMVLDADRDGVDQITAALAAVSDIESIHIVSHGAPGCLYLGNTELSLGTLAQYAPQIEAWNGAIADDASILLYGCNVAAGDAGAEFVAAFHHLTHAHIGASQTLTGNAAKGGNWDLEVTTGAIAPLAFDAAALAAYEGVLPAATGGDASWDIVDTDSSPSGNIASSVEGTVRGLDRLTFLLNGEAEANELELDTITTENGVVTATGADGGLANTGLTATIVHQVVTGANGKPVLRSFLTLSNAGTEAITATSLKLDADVAGSDVSVVGTSDGDTTFETSDRYVITSVGSDDGNPPVGVNTIAFFGDTPATTAVEADGPAITFTNLTVPAGGSKSFVFFNSISADGTEATADAAQFASADTLASSGLLVGLTAAQRTALGIAPTAGTLVVSPASGTTTEAGGAATFTIALSKAPEPGNTVTVNLASSDATEGTVDLSTLTFTAANFNVPQTITVRGVDDTAVDGNVAYSILTSFTSTDAAYTGNPADISLTNTDNDRASTPTPPAPTPTTGKTILGTARKDTLTGTEFNDVIKGKGENDTLFGNGGNDSMNGGLGNDKLFGGAGNDTLNGVRGRDRLFGGEGSDVFVIAARRGPDAIRDYQDGVDKIDLTGGLTFGSITLTQSGNNTVMRSGSEVLATLRGVASSTLSAADFV
jgi:Ca2+-binding RTX toxin-like protein